jgi:hypothetical protein
MERRKFLAALGAGAIPLAGCVSLGEPDDPENGTETPTTTGSTPSTTTGSATATDTPGSTLRDCPPPRHELASIEPGSGEWDVTVRCGEAATSGPVGLTASAPTLDGPRDQLTFELANGGDDWVPIYNDRGTLYRWYHGRWRYVHKRAGFRGWTGEDQSKIDPGATRRFHLNQNTADLDPVLLPDIPPSSQPSVARFTPGVYAFGYPVHLDDAAATPENASVDTPDAFTRLTTQFRVTRDPLPLVPSDSVVTTFRDGDTRVVQTDVDGTSRVSLLLERLDVVPEDAGHVDRFTLYNPHLSTNPTPVRFFVQDFPHLFRDGLAVHEGGAARIRIETDRDSSDFELAESFTLVYEGTAWRVTMEDDWGR